MKTKEVLFVILDKYADWETAALAAMINENEGYCVKTVSNSKEPVMSIGGFSTNPDYDISEAMSREFIGLILVGGYAWRSEKAKEVEKLVKLAVEKNVIIAAICDATVFLGVQGLLNNINHTSNEISDLQSYAGEKYTGESRYINQQSVRDGNYITANVSANLEFAKDVLVALDIMPVEKVEQWYKSCKLGLHSI